MRHPVLMTIDKRYVVTIRYILKTKTKINCRLSGLKEASDLINFQRDFVEDMAKEADYGCRDQLYKIGLPGKSILGD